MKSSAELYDIIRIDHFIGIVRYFAIPAENDTAEFGVYRPGPGKKLTDVIDKAVGDKQIIAEDLGVLIPKVTQLMQKCGYPGMKILQFAFGNGPTNEYLPHNYDHNNQIVYGGTHDNETLAGFFGDPKKEIKDLKYALEYLHINPEHKSREQLTRELTAETIRMGYATSSNVAIYQVQDILALDNNARMNEPSTVGKNWQWRLTPGQLTPAAMQAVTDYTCIYGRANDPKK